MSVLLICDIPPSHASPSCLAIPRVIAHRGGAEDAPENTLYAISTALEHGADMIWLSVQVTQDGVPVLYRPADLSQQTEGSGKVSHAALLAIRRLNAGYQFQQTLPDGGLSFPFRNHRLPIPTLQEALEIIPAHVPIFLDMKSLPALPLVRAVAEVLEKTHAWHRVRMYSTEAAHHRAWQAYPKARLFEDRDTTRQRLVDLMLGNACIPPTPGTWIGIELVRPVHVVEYFTLGKGISQSVAHWWTRHSMNFHRKLGRVNIVLFGIENKAAYQKAMELGADAVMTNSPLRLRSWRAASAR